MKEIVIVAGVMFAALVTASGMRLAHNNAANSFDFEQTRIAAAGKSTHQYADTLPDPNRKPVDYSYLYMPKH